MDAVFEKVRSLPEDAEIRSHWARYLCVLVSGFIEVSIRTLLSAYAEDKSGARVANFVEHELKGFQNPKMGKILDLVGAFSREWQEQVEDISDVELKDAVDSVVASRHQIAHGRTVGLSYVTIKKYYEGVVTAIENIETVISN